jgi:hypothetical protein
MPLTGFARYAATGSTIALMAVGQVGAIPRAASPLSALGDDFSNPARLSEWQLDQGDVQAGPPARVDVGRTTPGELTIVSSYSWWVDANRAFSLTKPVSGDFTATLQIRATGRHGGLPRANWSLTGLLVRAPGGDRAHENWIGWTIGAVSGTPVFERKTTQNSVSQLLLIPRTRGWVQLRIVRVDDQFALLRRYPGGHWVLQTVYARPDLPAALDVGIDALSGFDNRPPRPVADLVSHVDAIRFAETGVPPDVRQQVADGHVALASLRRYLTR